MNEIIERWLERLWSRRGTRVLQGDQQGQTLIFVALAFFTLLAVVGLGIDLGIVYIERVRVAQAVDAAALAAAPELPLERAAHMRAMSYLEGNGYGYGFDSARYAAGEYMSDPDETTTIWIDTKYKRETDDTGSEIPDSANRIKVRARRQVFMTFMQFIGFSHFPVEATAEAENVTRIDTVLVYDRSGSMENETLCYGCWEPDSDKLYPSGTIFPLNWSDDLSATVKHCANECEEADYVAYTPDTDYDVNDCNYRHRDNDEYYIVIEAEEYSSINVDYHRDYYETYKTYWVVQRNEINERFVSDDKPWKIEDVGAMGRGGRGAYLSHHPYRDAGEGMGYLGVSCTYSDLEDGKMCGSFPAPQVDYKFQVPSDDDYYIWIRGQGGFDPGAQHIFWGLDGNPYGTETGFPKGANYDGAVEEDDHEQKLWDWRCLGEKRFSGGDTPTLNLWAGGAGFDVDRILITTDDSLNCHWDADPPGDAKDFGPNNGRTDGACRPCDPRFAGCNAADPEHKICIPPPHCDDDMRYDDLYDDEQPIRDALEAAKFFIRLQDPRFDQIGYVSYSTKAKIENELECLREGRCTSPDDPEDVFPDIVAALDATRAGGGTNIADGIREGMNVLDTGRGHNGRPGSVHIIALMTDGLANEYPSDGCHNDKYLWPRDPSESDDPDMSERENIAADCVIYYALEARKENITIYTITLGWGADQDLMKAVADITGGDHYHAVQSEELGAIFEKLYERIFVRLIH